jgi:hypothetical protein
MLERHDKATTGRHGGHPGRSHGNRRTGGERRCRRPRGRVRRVLPAEGVLECLRRPGPTTGLHRGNRPDRLGAPERQHRHAQGPPPQSDRHPPRITADEPGRTRCIRRQVPRRSGTDVEWCGDRRLRPGQLGSPWRRRVRAADVPGRGGRGPAGGGLVAGHAHRTEGPGGRGQDLGAAVQDRVGTALRPRRHAEQRPGSGRAPGRPGRGEAVVPRHLLRHPDRDPVRRRVPHPDRADGAGLGGRPRE